MIENVVRVLDVATKGWREKVKMNSERNALEGRYYRAWEKLGGQEGTEVTLDQIENVIKSELSLFEFYSQYFPFNTQDKNKDKFYTKSREVEIRKLKEAKKLDISHGRLEAVLFFAEREEFPLDERVVKGSLEYERRAKSCKKAIELLEENRI